MSDNERLTHSEEVRARSPKLIHSGGEGEWQTNLDPELLSDSGEVNAALGGIQNLDANGRTIGIDVNMETLRKGDGPINGHIAVSNQIAITMPRKSPTTITSRAPFKSTATLRSPRDSEASVIPVARPCRIMRSDKSGRLRRSQRSRFFA